MISTSKIGTSKMEDDKRPKENSAVIPPRVCASAAGNARADDFTRTDDFARRITFSCPLNFKRSHCRR